MGAVLLLCTHTFASKSQNNYDSRLCGAEILVMYQDLKILLNGPKNSNIKKSLEHRLKSGSNTLKWMCRKNISKNSYRFDELQFSIAEGKLKEARAILLSLLSEFPFNLSNSHGGLQSTNAAIAIYDTYCKSCHYQDNLSLPFPIYSLEKMAKQQSKDEFYARMLIGVRGSEKINFRNPLSDEDIINLRNYLISK